MCQPCAGKPTGGFSVTPLCSVSSPSAHCLPVSAFILVIKKTAATFSVPSRPSVHSQVSLGFRLRSALPPQRSCRCGSDRTDTMCFHRSRVQLTVTHHETAGLGPAVVGEGQSQGWEPGQAGEGPRETRPAFQVKCWLADA